MAMVAGIGDSAEFHVHLSASPSPVKPGTRKRIAFEIFDPWKDLPVSKFQVIHERLFHAFLIRDCGEPDIQFNMVFARALMYRVWVQFQRNGAVNTARFDIPVKPLE